MAAKRVSKPEPEAAEGSNVGRQWSSFEAAYKYYIAEGFEVGKAVCTHCGHEQRSVWFPGTKKIQCCNCKHITAKVVERYAEP